MNRYADVLVASDFALDLGLDVLARALQERARPPQYDSCISRQHSWSRTHHYSQTFSQSHTRRQHRCASTSRSSLSTDQWSRSGTGDVGDT